MRTTGPVRFRLIEAAPGGRLGILTKWSAAKVTVPLTRAVVRGQAWRRPRRMTGAAPVQRTVDLVREVRDNRLLAPGAHQLLPPPIRYLFNYILF